MPNVDEVLKQLVAAAHKQLDPATVQDVTILRRVVRDAYFAGEDAGYQRRRAEETAGREPMDYETFRSMLGEGFHTAFRKAGDGVFNAAIWLLISKMDRHDWAVVLAFVADPIWTMLRDGGLTDVRISDSGHATLDDLAEHVLAHLRVPTAENARAELRVKSLLAQVFNLGRSVAAEELEDEWAQLNTAKRAAETELERDSAAPMNPALTGELLYNRIYDAREDDKIGVVTVPWHSVPAAERLVWDQIAGGTSDR